MKSSLAEWSGTLLGLGRSPWAPGTVGSAAALAVGLLAPASMYPQVIGGLALIAAVAGPWLANQMIGNDEDDDPSRFVLDEAAGMWIAMFRLDKPVDWLTLAIAFALFRALDIFKPWPIGPLERLHGGLGVMLDDIAAGAIALVIGLAAASLMG